MMGWKDGARVRGNSSAYKRTRVCIASMITAIFIASCVVRIQTGGVRPWAIIVTAGAAAIVWGSIPQSEIYRGPEYHERATLEIEFRGIQPVPQWQIPSSAIGPAFVVVPLWPLPALCWIWIWRLLRAYSKDRDTCRGCGYSLIGIASKRCPECGMERPGCTAAQARRRAGS